LLVAAVVMGKGTGKGKGCVQQSRVFNKLERRLLRQGRHSKKERTILLLREQKKCKQDTPTVPMPHPTQGIGDAAAAPQQHGAEVEEALQRIATQSATRDTRLAEATARGLSGEGVSENQMLRRLIRARAAEEAAQEAAAAQAVTPAAARLLESLRAEILQKK
jgi:SOS response regulatory protein OraA/RecX